MFKRCFFPSVCSRATQENIYLSQHHEDFNLVIIKHLKAHVANFPVPTKPVQDSRRSDISILSWLLRHNIRQSAFFYLVKQFHSREQKLKMTQEEGFLRSNKCHMSSNGNRALLVTYQWFYRPHRQTHRLWNPLSIRFKSLIGETTKTAVRSSNDSSNTGYVK